LVLSAIDAAQQATTTGLSMAACQVCGICHYSSAPGLASRYIRQAEQDAEREDRAANTRRSSTGSQVLTSPEFLSSLRSRGALAEVDVDPGWQVPDDGDFINDAEPDFRARHTDGSDDEEVDVEL
jgi:hypothetical protein